MQLQALQLSLARCHIHGNSLAHSLASPRHLVTRSYGRISKRSSAPLATWRSITTGADNAPADTTLHTTEAAFTEVPESYLSLVHVPLSDLYTQGIARKTRPQGSREVETSNGWPRKRSDEPHRSSGFDGEEQDSAMWLALVDSKSSSTSFAMSSQPSQQISSMAGQPSTIGYLLYALEHTRNTHAIPPDDHRRQDPTIRAIGALCLQGVLARYILATSSKADGTDPQRAAPRQETAAVSAADDAYLKKRGYNLANLEEWASLLVAHQVHRRIIALFGPQQVPERWPPIFIFTLILKRRAIHARSLRILVAHAWRFLAHRRDAALNVHDAIIFAIFKNLLRHARRVWPAGIVAVTGIFSTYLRHSTLDRSSGSASETSRSSRTSSLYNNALSLLAEPASEHPFKSSIYQETAQFDLVHAMATQEPPLRIQQKGYRALCQVLLSRTKTEQERDRTSLQAKSWPPWMRARTGVDETKGADYGLSRAAITIRRMVEAGYDTADWSRIAEIYAGRDTDGSPSVQTRMVRQRFQRGASTDALIWEARIRTTRTLREAWACFLSYRESMNSAPDELVYAAMIIKLLLARDAKSAAGREGSFATKASGNGDIAFEDSSLDVDEVQPGDTPTPFSEPTNPADLTYVARDCPNPLGLFREMLAVDVNPSAGIIAYILKHGRSMHDGLAFLYAAGFPYSGYARVLASGTKIAPEAIQEIPEPIFSSFIQLICRHSQKPVILVHEASRRITRSRQVQSLSKDNHWPRRKKMPADHAMRLMRQRQSTTRQLWAAVLKAFSGKFADPKYHRYVEHERHGEASLKLQKMSIVLAEMKRLDIALNMECLMAVSNGVENIVVALKADPGPIWRPIRRSNWTKYAIPAHKTADEVPLVGLDLHNIIGQHTQGEVPGGTTTDWSTLAQFLRRMFNGIVSDNEPSQTTRSIQTAELDTSIVPSLLAIPSGNQLHAYARALGVLGDHEGIWSLVQWMAEHHDDLWVQVLEEPGGKRRWTQLLCAIRVFLENPQCDARIVRAGLESKMSPASADLTALAKEKLNSIAEYRWPSDAMISWYVNPTSDKSPKPRRPAPSIANYI